MKWNGSTIAPGNSTQPGNRNGRTDTIRTPNSAKRTNSNGNSSGSNSGNHISWYNQALILIHGEFKALAISLMFFFVVKKLSVDVCAD
jgi:hypothetical protein